MILWFIDRFGIDEGTKIANAFTNFLELFGGRCEQCQVEAILEALYARRHTQRSCITPMEAKAEVLELLHDELKTPGELGQHICAIIDRMSDLPVRERTQTGVTLPSSSGEHRIPVRYKPREERIIVG